MARLLKLRVAQCVVFFVAVPLMMSSCEGCGGEDPGESCSPVGSRACHLSSHILTCNEDGVWEEEFYGCGGDEYCVDQENWAICIGEDCDRDAPDFCIRRGSTDCDGTVLQRCTGADCPMWTAVEDCADSGMVCTVDADGDATCVAGTGGMGGTGGTGGAGGTSNELAVLSSCSGDGLRGFIGFLDALGDLLRYVDGASDLPEHITYDADMLEFTWQMDVDGIGGIETTVGGELIESSGTLAQGIEFGEVIHADWTWSADAVSTGEGKLSIYGLNNETIRVTPLVEPRYDDGGACHVQFTNVYFHLDLSNPESERTAVQLGFWVEVAPYLLDNAFATFGETLITIDGQYLGEPFAFTLDAVTYELVP